MNYHQHQHQHHGFEADWGAEAESSQVKNIVVLGGSYGGMHAASILATQLPPSHRVILIERNSHFNHLYAFPRFSVLPGHAHKAYVPYSHIFRDSPVRRQKRKKSTLENLQNDRNQSMEPISDSDKSSDGSLRFSDSKSSGSGTGVGVGVGGQGSNSNTNATSSPSDYTSELKSEFSKAGVVGVGTSIAEEGTTASENQERPSIVIEDLKQALESGDGGEHSTQGISEVQFQKDDQQTQKNNQSTGGHEEEEGIEAPPHIVLQATATRITDTHVLVTSHTTTNFSKKKLWGIDSLSIPYTHLIYALGSHLPDPLRSDARTKKEGVEWMETIQDRIKESEKIVVVGGGPLGVQLATDIGSNYPKSKEITLIHSREQLLPNFDIKIHEIALKTLEDLRVKVVLGERLASTEGCPMGSGVSIKETSTSKYEKSSSTSTSSLLPHQKRITTTSGSTFDSDLLLMCTGQQPSSSLLSQFSPSSVDPTSRLIRVRPTLQIALPEEDEGLIAQMPFEFKSPCGDCDCFLDKKLSSGNEKSDNEGGDEDGKKQKHTLCFTNLYAIGDVADAFGALNAGYQAWKMADIAAGNILLDIQAETQEKKQDELKPLNFEPAPNLLKLSLGLGKVATQGAPIKLVENGVEREEVPVEVKEEEHDLGVELVWKFMALAPVDDMHL